MINSKKTSNLAKVAIAMIKDLRDKINQDIDGEDPIYPDRLVQYRQIALAAFDLSHGAVIVADFVAFNDFLCESEHDQIPEQSLEELRDLLPKL